MSTVSAAVLSLIAACGVALLVDPWIGGRWSERFSTARHEPALVVRKRLDEAGLGDLPTGHVLAMCGAGALGAAALGLVVLGAPLPTLALTVAGALAPLELLRHRRRRQIEESRESWPAMIEEIRLLCGSVGRSIPQAFFEVGLASGPELRPAFEAAHREWLLTRDLEATTDLLRNRLADPTADATCETLIIAHQLGGTDLDRRLAALAEDRRQDLVDRKDARSRQAGVRFARRFVLVVPLGMALVGLSIGDGRDAYRSALGQVMALAAVVLLAACWMWSGRILRLPGERRVFGR